MLKTFSPILQKTAAFGFVLCSAAIVILSLVPAPSVPIEASDKVLHVVAYAVLGLLAGFGWTSRARLYIWAATFIGSGIVELLQPFVRRSGDLMDLVANGSGLALSIVFICVWTNNRQDGRL